MRLLDNVRRTLLDDLEENVRRGARVSVVAANFSMHAYRELKKRLKGVERFRFIFAEPTFVEPTPPKSRRELYLPRLARENRLYGSPAEIRRGGATSQKALAQECAEWIRRKGSFKSNLSPAQAPGFAIVDQTVYAPICGFNSAAFGCERGELAYSPVFKTDDPESVAYFERLFEALWNDPQKFQDVTEATLKRLDAASRENSPEFLYYFALRHLFQDFLEELSEDELPDDAVGFKESQIWNALYDFQKDAALAILSKLERYGGCVLADAVGLGKTFTALAVVKYYENRNRSVLVLCPKKLSGNWNAYKNNYADNPFSTDRLRYDVLYHTDLSRDRGFSNGIDLERLNWGAYDLIVIDESHNFRNGGEISGAAATENRYLRLLNRAIRAGVKTRVLMLSATPVNNRFVDLKKQLELAYEGDATRINEKLGPGQNVDEIFRRAQKAFNLWSKRPTAERSVDALLKTLDFDFFKLLDALTIARSRRHIEKYYDVAAVGKFPERLAPISLRPRLTDLPGAVNYDEIYAALAALNLSVYAPSRYLHRSAVAKYDESSSQGRAGLSLQGREEGLRRLMGINLLKRLESSVYSFRLTLTRIRDFVDAAIQSVEDYRARRDSGDAPSFDAPADASDFDLDDQGADVFVVRKRSKILLADLDYLSWLRDLKSDAAVLERLTARIADFTPERDAKLQALLSLVRQKIAAPINPGNRKIVVFTAFADTADYLYERVGAFVKENFGLEAAKITGSSEGKTTLPGSRADFSAILARFSPKSQGRVGPAFEKEREIDLLIATDCVSEGQNLQDCDYLVNYDVHWNPARIIQRFGRIDRIGGSNARIQLVNFWPDVELDEYVDLKNRVENRMRVAVLTATGDDDPINADEKGDLEYRKAQLERLQGEAADFDDEIGGGVSVADLGLNEFRSDLLEFLKREGGDALDATPNGIYAIAPKNRSVGPGVLFLLKKIDADASADRDERNRLFPYYLIFVGENGDVVGDYLDPKRTLDAFRLLCKGRSEPIWELCRQYNEETQDGRDVRRISEALERAAASIVARKNEDDLDSLFRVGGTTALKSPLFGLDDFKLICWLVVR